MLRGSQALIAPVLVSMGLAGFGAFTAQFVNLTAHVVQRPTIDKFIVSEPPIEQAAVDQLTAPFGVDNCIPGDTEPPIQVPIKTCVWWVVAIVASNPFDEPIEEVVVRDRFGAELGVVILDALLTRGEAEEQLAQGQYRIFWCVTGQIVPNGPGIDAWKCLNGGQMAPGDPEALFALVFTRLNPAGKQEYTTPGTYQLNSGAVMKWIFSLTGRQGSAETAFITIEAFDPLAPLRINTNIDFGIVLPGTTVHDNADGTPAHFELCLNDGVSHVDYDLNLLPQPLTPDMRPHLLVERDFSEPDTEPDPQADGRLGDHAAEGALDRTAGDLCDTWVATLFAPHCQGSYNPATDPSGSGGTVIDCTLDDNGSTDPQDWRTGSGLGAQVEIVVGSAVPP